VSLAAARLGNSPALAAVAGGDVDAVVPVVDAESWRLTEV
jgi:hypothetical protein